MWAIVLLLAALTGQTASALPSASSCYTHLSAGPVSTIAALDLGVNGIHAREGYLYFANSAQQLYARFPIDPNGMQAGDVQVLTRGLSGLVDDFDFLEASNRRDRPGAAIAALGMTGEVVVTPGDADACANSVLAQVEGATAVKVVASKLRNGSRTVFVTSAGNESAYDDSRADTTSGALSCFKLYY